jgi:hypothetical protein
VWKRFWRLSRSGTFEAFFDALAARSETAHLVQMFDSTVVRAHVSAITNAAAQESCSSLAPGVIDFPIERIKEVVQPTGDQFITLNELSAAVANTNDIIKASCPTAVPLGRPAGHCRGAAGGRDPRGGRSARAAASLSIAALTRSGARKASERAVSRAETGPSDGQAQASLLILP